MIDYFLNNIWQLWALLALFCLILELTAGDFFLVCFSMGALCTAVVSALGGNIYVQLLVFALTSVLCIFLVRPPMLKKLHGKNNERLSNTEALISREGRVTQAIEQGGYGRVAIDGDDWKSRSADGSAIAVGSRVKVVSQESVIITVEPC